MPEANMCEKTILVHFNLMLEDGSIAESTYEQKLPVLINLSDGSMSEAFVAQVNMLQQGEKKKFTLSAVDAFGEREASLLHQIARTDFAKDLPVEVGTIVAFTQPNGQEIPGVLLDVSDEKVLVDFNHPLAGEDITFDMEIVAVNPEAKQS